MVALGTFFLEEVKVNNLICLIDSCRATAGSILREGDMPERAQIMRFARGISFQVKYHSPDQCTQLHSCYFVSTSCAKFADTLDVWYSFGVLHYCFAHTNLVEY